MNEQVKREEDIEQHLCKTCKYFECGYIEDKYKILIGSRCGNEIVEDYVHNSFVGFSPDENFGCILWEE